MRRALPAIVLSLGVVLAACGGSPPEPEEVSKRTASILVPMIEEISNAAEQLRDMPEIEAFFNGLEVVGVVSADEPLEPPLEPPPVPKPDTASAEPTAEDEVLDLLNNYIFTAGNLKRTDGDWAIFELDGGLLCERVGTSESCSAAPGEEPVCVEEASPDCVEIVNKLQITIAARLVGDVGVEFGLAMGPNPSFVKLTLQPNNVAVEVNLESAKETLAHVAKVMEEPLPELPTTVQGVVAVVFAVEGPGKLSLATGIKQSLHVAGTTSDGPYKLRVEASDPMVGAKVSTQEKRIELDLNSKMVELLTPASAFFSEVSGDLRLLIQGFTGAFLAQDGQPVQVTGFGLGAGPSSMTLDGKTLFEISLNADDGNKLDLTMEPVQEMPQCTLTPLLDLKLKVDLTPVESSMDEPLDDLMRDESYRLLISSPEGSPIFLPYKGDSALPDSTDGLKMIKGSLTLESVNNPATVTVPEGSCLTYVDSLEPGQAPIERFQSVACP